MNAFTAVRRYRSITQTLAWRLAVAACVVAVAALGLVGEAIGAGPPTVTAVWPRTGPLAGGTPLTVAGSGFSAGTPSVTVDGIPAGSVSVVSDSVLKVTAPRLPNGTTPTGVVTVSTSQGTSSSTSPLATYTYRAGVALAVPSYFYALTSSWGTLDGPPRTADLAVVNPASGPGSAVDPNYVQQAAASQAAGVDVVGYVYTNYGRRSLSSVEADITRYEQWYHVNGIFVDQSATGCSTEASYYAPLYAFIHAQAGLDLTVLNPGAPTPACYMAASDVMMTFEGTPSDLAAGASTVPGYDPSRFWGVVYSARASALASDLTTLTGDGFGAVFVTDQNLPNPYGVLPSYWSQEVAAVGTPAPPAQPVVSGVSPNTGPAAGGTQVTVSGSNLSSGSVAFGATAATGVACSASSCTATAPAGSGTVDVRVSTTGGTSPTSGADRFTYQAPPAQPVVSGVSPNTGPAAGGTQVTVSGSNLSSGSVAFGATAATGVACSASSCTATAPAGSGTVDVRVSTTGGTSPTSGADRFTYQAPPAQPVVSGVSPNTGPAAGGTQVTVSGSNLSSGSVAFGATAATGVACSASSCTATAPAGSGTVDVRVSTTGGTSPTSGADRFTYQAPPAQPVVSGVSPNTGPAAGGTQVTVSGSNLSSGSVAFGATAATGVACSASSCTATAPAGSGTVDVRVSTTGGTSPTSGADQFTYQAPPGPANLIPDPGFETSAVPADYWGSTVARSGAVVHSGSGALAQTVSSSTGGWELDLNPGWSAPITSAKTYSTSIWVRSTATATVDVNLDLLGSGGTYVDSVSGSWVTLAANTWTQLALTGIKPTSSEIQAVVEADFSQAATGTVIYWDDMSVTSP